MADKRAYELKANVSSWMYTLADGSQLHLHDGKPSMETSDPDVMRELDQIAADPATGIKHGTVEEPKAAKGGKE